MKNTLIIIGLAVLSLVLGYFVITQGQSIKSLEKSNKVQENQLNKLRKDNFTLIDSFNSVNEDYIEQDKEQEERIKSQLKKIDSILNTIPDEKDVDDINDLDSLQQLFTKYYPHNSKSSKGRDKN